MKFTGEIWQDPKTVFPNLNGSKTTDKYASIDNNQLLERLEVASQRINIFLPDWKRRNRDKRTECSIGQFVHGNIFGRLRNLRHSEERT